MSLTDKVVLVTGGTGSFGRRFAETALLQSPRKLIIYSRDELKQFEMQQELSDERLRFFLGDVRDRERLTLAMRSVDVVIHAAALKQVPAAEYNPTECLATNIGGSENIVHAALANRVSRVLALSTDKACHPVNLYGATKLCMEKLLIAANSLSGDIGTKFSVVRYGNVADSRGSVLQVYRKLIAEGRACLPVTHPEMTRFWITLDQGVGFVIASLDRMQGAEIFIPKLPSVRISALAGSMAKQVNIVGIRPGEKIHEILVTKEESVFAEDEGDRYTLRRRAVRADEFTYSSDANAEWVVL